MDIKFYLMVWPHDLRSDFHAGWKAFVNDWEHSKACHAEAEERFNSHPEN